LVNTSPDPSFPQIQSVGSPSRITRHGPHFEIPQLIAPHTPSPVGGRRVFYGSEVKFLGDTDGDGKNEVWVFDSQFSDSPTQGFTNGYAFNGFYERLEYHNGNLVVEQGGRSLWGSNQSTKVTLTQRDISQGGFGPDNFVVSLTSVTPIPFGGNFLTSWNVYQSRIRIMGKSSPGPGGSVGILKEIRNPLERETEPSQQDQGLPFNYFNYLLARGFGESVVATDFKDKDWSENYLVVLSKFEEISIKGIGQGRPRGRIYFFKFSDVLSDGQLGDDSYMKLQNASDVVNKLKQIKFMDDNLRNTMGRRGKGVKLIGLTPELEDLKNANLDEESRPTSPLYRDSYSFLNEENTQMYQIVDLGKAHPHRDKVLAVSVKRGFNLFSVESFDIHLVSGDSSSFFDQLKKIHISNVSTDHLRVYSTDDFDGDGLKDLVVTYRELGTAPLVRFDRIVRIFNYEGEELHYHRAQDDGVDFSRSLVTFWPQSHNSNAGFPTAKPLIIGASDFTETDDQGAGKVFLFATPRRKD
jgi:hypothetical protein